MDYKRIHTYKETKINAVLPKKEEKGKKTHIIRNTEIYTCGNGYLEGQVFALKI